MVPFRIGIVGRPTSPPAERGTGATPSRAPGRRAQLLTLASTCLGLFLVQTDTTAVNLALPAVSRRLHQGGLSLALAIGGAVELVGAVVAWRCVAR